MKSHHHSVYKIGYNWPCRNIACGESNNKYLSVKESFKAVNK